MPIYEYECRKCGEKFEKRRSISDDDRELACPKCGAEKPSRVFSVFATTAPGGGSSCSTTGG